MSVTFTFSAQDGEHAMIGIPCDCQFRATGLTFADVAGLPFDDPRSEAYWDARACEHNEYDVNVSNVNARMVLEDIGLADSDLCGTVSASFFVQQVRGNLLCYRREELLALGEEAVRRHLSIGWA